MSDAREVFEIEMRAAGFRPFQHNADYYNGPAVLARADEIDVVQAATRVRLTTEDNETGDGFVVRPADSFI